MKKKKNMGTICENCVYLYFTPPVIVSSIFLQACAVTFSHVLHLDVLRRQIELKMKVKIMYGYNAEPPIAIPR